MIHLLQSKASQEQHKEMLETLGTYVKLAVDIDRRILAGGGEFHADCEAVLLDHGSRQETIWGADWIPKTQEVRFEALINIRPKQGNPSMNILDTGVREKVESVVRELLEDI